MALNVDIYLPTGTINWEIGVANVQNINIHYYYGNVCYTVIFFTDGSYKKYYQIPAVLNTPPPTP